MVAHLERVDGYAKYFPYRKKARKRQLLEDVFFPKGMHSCITDRIEFVVGILYIEIS